MTAAWTVAYITLAAAVLFLFLLVIGLMRRIAYVLEQAESHLGSAGFVTASSSGGLAPGTTAPVVGGVRPDGSRFSTDEFDGRPSIVLFLSSTCEPCKALARELRRKLRRAPLAVDLVVVVRDEAERDALGLVDVDVVYQPDFSLARGFATSATPHAFALNRERVIVASSTPNTVRLLRELAASIPEDGGAATPRPRLAQVSTDDSEGR